VADSSLITYDGDITLALRARPMSRPAGAARPGPQQPGRERGTRQRRGGATCTWRWRQTEAGRS
jgi:hypothetical protein